MNAMQDDLDRLREACLDFAYEVVKALGMIALVRRLGMEPKSWILEREQRPIRSGQCSYVTRHRCAQNRAAPS